MKPMTLTEAFKELDLLNEDTFKVDDEGVNELKDFIEDDEKDETISIIDPEAEDESEIEDNYVGKAILDCKVCHSKLYKDMDDVVIDEESEVVNIDDECPYCYATEGFEVIGKVAEFDDDESEEIDIEDDEKNSETKEENSLEEGLFGFKSKKEKDAEAKAKHNRSHNNGRDCHSESIKEGINERFIIKLDNMNGSRDAFISKNAPINTNDEELFNDTDSWFTYNKNDAKVFNSHSDAEQFWDEYVIGVPLLADDDDTWSMEDCIIKYNSKMESFKTRKSRSIKEGINDISLTTDEFKMGMTDDNGKITVTTEPISNDIEMSDEVIKPLDDEDIDSIEFNGEEEEVEEEVNEFSEEEFDELGESYLREIYDNVKSFKTSNVSSKCNTLIIEGLIGFKSGKTKKTTFKFEAKEITKRGKVKFLGENCQITKNQKAFTLIGSLKNGKLTCESLNYRYSTRDLKEGKMRKIYGTKRLTEATKVKTDLSKKEGSIANILLKNKLALTKVSSKDELIKLVKDLFKENNIDTPASRRLITNMSEKRDLIGAQFVLYNSYLYGTGNEVIK